MIAARLAQTPVLGESHCLGMAEMGFAGLSEQWLLRRAGDLHWRLIAGAMGQAEAVFTCAEGRPLYAAFCATRLTLARPDLPRLSGRLDLAGRLFRVGRGRLGSHIEITADGQTVGRLALISVFVGRDAGGSNRGLVRRAPRAVALPTETAPGLDALARQAAAAGRTLRHWPDDGSGRWLLPCPALDFNAAGLLYFPTFSALAERCAFEDGAAPGAVPRRRSVCYLGNVEPGERVRVRATPRRRGWLTAIHGADGRPLALVRTE